MSPNRTEPNMEGPSRWMEMEMEMEPAMRFKLEEGRNLVREERAPIEESGYRVGDLELVLHPITLKEYFRIDEHNAVKVVVI